VEITLKQISEGQLAIIQVLKQPMSFKLAYRMRKVARQLSAEIENIAVIRNDMIKKYGTKIKNTTQYQVPQEKIAEFTKELEDFLALRVVTPLEKIPFECLEAMEVTPLALLSLSPFLTDFKEDGSLPNIAKVEEDPLKAKKKA